MLKNQSFGLKFVRKLLKANNSIPTPPTTPHSLTMISSKKLNIFIFPRNVKRTFQDMFKIIHLISTPPPTHLFLTEVSTKNSSIYIDMNRCNFL